MTRFECHAVGRRAYGSHDMNEHSSRSHTICRFRVVSCPVKSDGPVVESVLVSLHEVEKGIGFATF